MVTVERNASSNRIERDIETLAGAEYTLSEEATRRYAYTEVYRNTLDYFGRELEKIGFELAEDPVGTLVARNRPPGEPAFGIGSHCDSNRNGGKYDGRSFWEHAEEAGYEPARWREAIHVLDGLTGWIEMHIEQARVLQDTGNRIGIVSAIAGYVHADVVVQGRGDHAGATPMDLRLDPTLPLAETIAELERLATAAGKGTVGTVGEIDVDPGLINAIAAGVRFSLDIRGPDDDAFQGVARAIAAFAQESARRRGMTAEVRQRQTQPSTPLDERIVGALEEAARATGEPWITMHSGAAHDTMCVADYIPSAMVFVPCKDGISHHPAEDASPADAALAAEIILNAIRSLSEGL